MYKSCGLTVGLYLLVAERRARPFSLTAVSKRDRACVIFLTHAAADHVVSAREQGCLMWRRSRDLIPPQYVCTDIGIQHGFLSPLQGTAVVSTVWRIRNVKRFKIYLCVSNKANFTYESECDNFVQYRNGVLR